MSRTSWLDADHHPIIDEYVNKLEHFTQAMADGVIDKKELATAEQALVAAMTAAEGTLSDDAHAKVTHLLAELAAYTVMVTLHEFTSARIAAAIK